MAASIAYQGAQTQGSGSPFSIAVTVASATGQERLVALLGIANASVSTTTFSSVTVDGQAATQVGTYVRASDGTGGGQNGAVVSFWRAPGTSGTSITVAATASGAMFDGRCAVWTLSNAGTVLDTATASYSSAVIGDLTLDVDTATGGAVAAAFLAYNSSTHTATWSGLTERFDGGVLYGNDWYSVADTNTASASTPLAVTADIPNDFSGGSSVAALAISFNPAAGGTTLTAAAGSYTLTGSDATFPAGAGQQIIDIGDAINDGTGDPARVAFDKCNANFTELYTADTTFLTTTVAATTYAPLASPTFTGNPQAPTPAATDNDTSIATTAFVKSAVAVANQIFYCDPTDAADVATYKRLLLTPSTHAESSVPVSCTGTSDVLVGAFITDPGVPGAIEYPAGSAYRRLYGKVSAGVARFHLQVYTRTTGGVETLARDEFSNSFSDLSATLQEWLATPSSSGALAATDRIVVKIYAQRVSGPTTITVTFYAEGSTHASQVQTTITTGSSAPISATPPLTLSGGNLAIDLSAYQPLDADLTALAALTGTNTIYYRSAANTWTAVNVSTGLSFSGGNLTATGGGFGPPQGRLTLQSATPVMTSTQSAKTTIYYVPYAGNLVPIYDGTNFVMTSTNVSVATTDTSKSPAAIGASKVNDWFVWDDAGTLRLSHGPDWASDTTRVLLLAQLNGIWVNNIAITNGPASQRGTYVGTTRSNASSQLDWIYGAAAANGTAGFFGVWNCYNRVLVTSITRDTTASWSYTTAAWRAANNSASMRTSYVCGLQEDSFVTEYINLAGASNNTGSGIGYDTTTAISGVNQLTDASGAVRGITAKFSTSSLGFHFLSAIEYGATGAVFYGLAGFGPGQTGLHFQGLM